VSEVLTFTLIRIGSVLQFLPPICGTGPVSVLSSNFLTPSHFLHYSSLELSVQKLMLLSVSSIF